MESVRTAIWGNNVRPACKKPRTHAKKIQSASGVLRDPSRITKGVLRVPPRPPRTKRCSSWPFVDQKVFFATLRVPSRIKKGVLRVSPRPPRTKRCSSWPLVALRGSKGVLHDPSRAFVDKERCSPRLSASSADKKMFFVALSGPSWIKRFSSSLPSSFPEKATTLARTRTPQADQ